MKKLTSIILALVLVLSLGTVAFAATTDDYEDYLDVAPVVPKTYQINNGTAPAETFTFSFAGQSYVNGDGKTVDDATIPAIADVTIAYDAISSTTKKTVEASVNANDYELGVYTYKVTETAGSTAGVTYSEEELYLVLTILRDETNGQHYVAAMHYESADGTDKSSGFTNQYDAGSLKVTKKISGNMADMEKEFAFTIVFTAPTSEIVSSTISVSKPDGTTDAFTFADGENTYTYTIDLGHEDTVTFTNLPEGVTYEVSENAENYTKVDEKYSDSAKTISANDVDTYEVTNKLSSGIDTGVFVDSLPYVMMLAIAAFGLVMFFSKKRLMREN